MTMKKFIVVKKRNVIKVKIYFFLLQVQAFVLTSYATIILDFY